MNRQSVETSPGIPSWQWQCSSWPHWRQHCRSCAVSSVLEALEGRWTGGLRLSLLRTGWPPLGTVAARWSLLQRMNLYFFGSLLCRTLQVGWFVRVALCPTTPA